MCKEVLIAGCAVRPSSALQLQHLSAIQGNTMYAKVHLKTAAKKRLPHNDGLNCCNGRKNREHTYHVSVTPMLKCICSK